MEIFRLEQWREKAIAGIDASLKERKSDPVKAELDTAMKRIGELAMQDPPHGNGRGVLLLQIRVHGRAHRRHWNALGARQSPATSDSSSIGRCGIARPKSWPKASARS